MTTDDRAPSHLLVGVTAANPLGYLAALGTLSALSAAWPDRDVRLAWAVHGSQWRPVLHLDPPASAEEIVEALAARLASGGQDGEFDLAVDGAEPFNNLSHTPAQYHTVCERAARESLPESRRLADFCAAFGTDAFHLEWARGKSSARTTVADTELRTVNGAGHQHFLLTMRELVPLVESRRIRATLFSRWSYADKKYSLRWDPLEDRRYALRANDPGPEGARTVWGANRLAVEALPLLPTAPLGRTLATTGFRRKRRTVTFSWPVWGPPLSKLVVRSVLAHPVLVMDHPSPAELRSIGIIEVFRAVRVQNDKYRNFTPGRPLLGALAPDRRAP